MTITVTITVIITVTITVTITVIITVTITVISYSMPPYGYKGPNASRVDCILAFPHGYLPGAPP